MLELSEITLRYGGLVAVDRVSMTFEPGRITGVIGPNGAGKTTLFNVATGFETPSTGKVLFEGDDVTRMRPERRAQRGLARTFQRLELFSALTVRENVMVAANQKRAGRTSDFNSAKACDEILERLSLDHLAEELTGTLPTGSGRMLELARALVARPRVLLLDEPASGQDEAETFAFDAVLSDLCAEGMAIALVEHDLSLVMRVCQHIYVLDLGRLIAEGSPEEVQADPRVQDAYLGQPV